MRFKVCLPHSKFSSYIFSQNDAINLFLINFWLQAADSAAFLGRLIAKYYPGTFLDSKTVV